MTKPEALELIREIFSEAEVVVYLALLAAVLLLIIGVAATLYPTYFGTAIQ